jgi:cytochrome b pre-mRNA-processing protein 3
MSLGRLLKPRRTVQSGRRLYEAAVAQAREPALYLPPGQGGLGAPDTVEGRFELYTLHVVLLLHRLKPKGGDPRAREAADLAQTLFDAYLQGLDDSLRELGVGDLSVGKKMRKLGEAFYGRAKSYDEALGRLPDRQPLAAVIARTVLAGSDADESPPAESPAAEARTRADSLVAYAAAAVGVLESVPLDALLDGRAQWPQAAA